MIILLLFSEKKIKKTNPACNQNIVIYMVSDEDAEGLKSEKKKEYNTSGRRKILFTEQLILPLIAHMIGSADINIRRTLQTIQTLS